MAAPKDLFDQLTSEIDRIDRELNRMLKLREAIAEARKILGKPVPTLAAPLPVAKQPPEETEVRPAAWAVALKTPSRPAGEPHSLPLVEKITAFLPVSGPSSVNAIATGVSAEYQQVYNALVGRFTARFRKYDTKEWGLKSPRGVPA